DLMADGRLDPHPLVSHRFGVADAPAAYDVIAGGAPSLAVVLSYPEKNGRPEVSARTVTLRGGAPATGRGVVGVIGAGNFASRMLIPALAKAGAQLDTIASAEGGAAAVVGKGHGFRQATTDAAAMLRDASVDTIVVATRHDSHADWVVRALEAGKHVFVEKPLALAEPELDRVRAALASSPGVLCVGFNRRFAPLVQDAQRLLVRRTDRKSVVQGKSVDHSAAQTQ